MKTIKEVLGLTTHKSDKYQLEMSAISKILHSEADFCSGRSGSYGLCHFTLWMYENEILTLGEYIAFKILLEYRAEAEGRDCEDFLWPKGEWEPRKEWLESELKRIGGALLEADIKIAGLAMLIQPTEN